MKNHGRTHVKFSDIALLGRNRKGLVALTYKGQPILNRKDLIVQLLKEQDGRCAICPNLLVEPHLDHDHITNEVRGLLCFPCNVGLGSFKDDPALLAKAIEYLTGKEILVPEPL